jgi:hypothetical protein
LVLLYDFDLQNRFSRGVRPGDPGAAVNRFRYLADPLFLVASSLYALNRFVLKPRVHSAFLHNHFNDLLLIPCALPPLLLMQRWLKLRAHDGFPELGEIALYLAVWSVLFEVLGPHIMPWTVGDPWDIVAYTVGAIFAAFWWRGCAVRLGFSQRGGTTTRGWQAVKTLKR